MPDVTLTYYGKVTERGSLELPRKRFAKEIRVFSGAQVEITVRKKRKRRTSPQNRYYWGAVIPAIIQAFIDLGHEGLQIGSSESAETIHAFLKGKFLDNGLEIADAHGEAIKLPASTTRCTTSEFMDYLADIQKWAAEVLGIVVPDPGEQMEFF